MEQIIKKAIEGGWITFNKDDTQKEKDYKVKVFVENPCQVVIQQSFWQALGKACGWKNDEWVTCLYGCQIMFDGEGCHHNISTRDKPRIPFWQYHALKFHEINLTQGFDKAVEYLKEITN